jgi:hypothetical protein
MTHGMVCVHHPAVVAHQREQGDRIVGANDRYAETRIETRMSPWARRFNQMPHNIRMHLTGYSGLRPLPPAGDAGR